MLDIPPEVEEDLKQLAKDLNIRYREKRYLDTLEHRRNREQSFTLLAILLFSALVGIIGWILL